MDPYWWIQNGFGEVKTRILNSEPISLIKLSTRSTNPIYSRKIIINIIYTNEKSYVNNHK